VYFSRTVLRVYWHEGCEGARGMYFEVNATMKGIRESGYSREWITWICGYLR